jgi:hypothetical protein
VAAASEIRYRSFLSTATEFPRAFATEFPSA